MSRLTKKYDDNSGYRTVEDDNSHGVSIEVNLDPYYECVDKLGKLEDLTDELGCPLDVVFRAIENGIIIMGSTDKYGDSTIWVDTIPVTVTIEGKHTFEEPRLIKYEEWCFSCKNGSYSGCVALKDYKKTWWLSSDLEE